MEHVNGWCFRGIYKGGLWEDDLHLFIQYKIIMCNPPKFIGQKMSLVLLGAFPVLSVLDSFANFEKARFI